MNYKYASFVSDVPHWRFNTLFRIGIDNTFYEIIKVRNYFIQIKIQ